MRIYDGISRLAGNTPLMRLGRIGGVESRRILCKLEFFNPTFSIKDRIAVEMIDAAELRGELKPGGVIIEATSGNTGLGLAMVAASRGYRLIIVMPESMSVERRALMSHLGAELVLTGAAEGMRGAINRAMEIFAATPGAFMPRQFDNPDNPAAHEKTTAAEIWDDTDGQVDIFVAGIGTGGTITGVGRELKRRKPGVIICGVEPDESAVLSGGEAGQHVIQGIGAGFKPSILDMSVIDRIVRVKGDDAIRTARELAVVEGILAGISSGANVRAALELAAMPEYAGKTIVTIICDTGERYMSTSLFEHDR